MEDSKKIRVPYALAVHDQAEINAVLELFGYDEMGRSKTIMGPKIEEFENRVAQLFGKRYGIMLNSGSSANLLAVKTLNFPKGSEIITPVLTFATTVAPLLQEGLKPVFIEVDPETYQIDANKIEAKITKNTRGIMIPSLIGNLPDFKKLKEICDKHHLAFIEDSCDTLGATFNGIQTGRYSDISTTSFYGSHIITAGGGGGMICVNDDSLNRKCKIFRGWGRSSAIDEGEDLAKRFGMKVEDIDYDSKFIFSEIAYNFLPTEMSAAFGIAQLNKLPEFTRRRELAFSELKTFFKQYERYFILPKQLPEVKTNWLGFPLTIREHAPFTRTQITKFLEENNIQTRPIFTGNILKQPAFKHLAQEVREDFPVTDRIMKRGFLVGCHHGLTREQLDYMKNKFTEFLSRI
jgi:CDP-4-dehydro-6-deoxyglucose reductase, E1